MKPGQPGEAQALCGTAQWEGPPPSIIIEKLIQEMGPPVQVSP